MKGGNTIRNERHLRQSVISISYHYCNQVNGRLLQHSYMFHMWIYQTILSEFFQQIGRNLFFMNGLNNRGICILKIWDDKVGRILHGFFMEYQFYFSFIFATFRYNAAVWEWEDSQRLVETFSWYQITNFLWELYAFFSNIYLRVGR